MNLTNEILLFNHFLIMSDFCVLLYYLNFVFYCTHVLMSYVLNSYLLTYLTIGLALNTPVENVYTAVQNEEVKSEFLSLVYFTTL